MAATIQDVVDAVTAETSHVASLKAFVDGLKQQLADALAAAGQLTPEQQAALDGVFAQVHANDQAITDAMAANVTPPPAP